MQELEQRMENAFRRAWGRVRYDMDTDRALAHRAGECRRCSGTRAEPERPLSAEATEWLKARGKDDTAVDVALETAGKSFAMPDKSSSPAKPCHCSMKS